MPIDQIGSAALASGTPTRLQLPSGSILQMVTSQSSTFSSTTTQIPVDNTIPQITEGAEFLTATITPTSATSKLIITINTMLSPNTANWVCIALFQDSTANALASNISYMPTATGGANLQLTYSMTSGNTNSTTFRFRYGPGGATTCYINGTNSQLFSGTLYSTLTVMEVAA